MRFCDDESKNCVSLECLDEASQMSKHDAARHLETHVYTSHKTGARVKMVHCLEVDSVTSGVLQLVSRLLTSPTY